jgi:hypothetical protein
VSHYKYFVFMLLKDKYVAPLDGPMYQLPDDVMLFCVLVEII